MDISDKITIASWILGLVASLIASNIGLFLWMSRRELDKNDLHKKEMGHQSEKYLQLHLDIINEKIKNLMDIMARNEIKSEDADGEIKAILGLSRENERSLFKQDENISKETSEKMALISAQIASLSASQKKRSTDQ